MNKDLFLTNSLNGKKSIFTPINSKKIGMYVCGPTVYDNPHIGNARPLVIFDILYKVLKCKYGKNAVTYVRNITDIDDKIITSSIEKKISITELTEDITSTFHDNCKYLICENPTHEPKATESISIMIEMIEVLLKNGFAYESDKHVYFEVSKFKDYGKLSNKQLDELIAGARIEVSKNKKNPADFVLWKPSTKEEPSWNSPWGSGRPGWHIECSAMSKKFLGDTFDIHGGGRDLIFPHHENEIAQSRCANQKNVFANYWIHNGFITISNEKMSKSQGNILKISDFKNKINGQVLRLALISSHYKQPLDWNEKLILESEKTLNKWYEAYIKIEKTILIPEEYLSPLYDDLNTPGYIANLHKLFDKCQKGSMFDREVFVSACNFIGLLTEDKNIWHQFKQEKISLTEDQIKQIIKERNQARKNKDFIKADKIRKQLLDKGVLIEDKDDKTSWKFK